MASDRQSRRLKGLKKLLLLSAPQANSRRSRLYNYRLLCSSTSWKFFLLILQQLAGDGYHGEVGSHAL